MTNLEFYKNEINALLSKEASPYVSKKIGGAFEIFSINYAENYPNNAYKFIDWLLEEHKERIKLTRFEYDLICCVPDYDRKNLFVNMMFLREMKQREYFKDIKNLQTSIEYILDNCEVVE